MHNRNLIWNLAGFLMPALAALFAVPQLIDLIGFESFGLHSIGWVLFGFLGILDFGLAKSITFFVAKEPVGSNSKHLYKTLSDYLTGLMVALGLLWMILLWVGNSYLLNFLLVTDELRLQAEESVNWLALAIPFMMFANARLAALEGQQRVVRLNLYKIPFGVTTFVVP